MFSVKGELILWNLCLSNGIERLCKHKNVLSIGAIETSKLLRLRHELLEMLIHFKGGAAAGSRFPAQHHRPTHAESERAEKRIAKALNSPR